MWLTYTFCFRQCQHSCVALANNNARVMIGTCMTDTYSYPCSQVPPSFSLLTESDRKLGEYHHCICNKSNQEICPSLSLPCKKHNMSVALYVEVGSSGSCVAINKYNIHVSLAISDRPFKAVAQIGELPIMLNIEGCVVVTKLGFTAGEESMFYSKSYLHWPHLETISL